ncbi:tyrosine-protein kinase HTK16-like isoform X2 [Convolutriloba macropyga]
MNRPYINVDEQLKDERVSYLKLAELSWYHGKVSRDQAEELLKSKASGSYLIRESSSYVKTVVLSAVFSETIVHYQIMRDVFCVFCLDDNSIQPFIGLDSLLNHLKSSNTTTSETQALIPQSLTNFVPGEVAPFDYLAKAPNSLLHEQCKVGDVKTARAILCSAQFDKRGLNWRNEEGKAPLHIAAEYGNTEILRMLVNSGAYIDNINSNGETSLHVACKAGHFYTVTALVQHGASINKFAVLSKLTGLHYAAQFGNFKIFEWLVQSGAALFAVDCDRKTPLEVANERCHSEIVDYVISHKFQRPKFLLPQFLHPELSRYQAHDILKDHGGEDGLFLVRGSKRCLGPVLSLISKNRHLNYEIQKRLFQIGDKEVEMYAIDDSPYFPSLELLVDYFASDRSLSAFKLTKPVGPILREPLTIDASSSSALLAGSNNEEETTKGVDNGGLLAQNAVLIAPDELTFGRTIGQGAYGEVVQAIWTRKGSISPSAASIASQGGSVPNSPIDMSTSCANMASENVAVKKIVAMKDSNCQLDFLSEVRALFSINHPGIVKLIGISFGPPVMLITELVNGGSLLDYLIDNGDAVTLQQMVAWSAQIARPMAYLESRKLIHRDLAARNILLKSYKMCKICDFGLSRMVGEGKEYYVATKGGKWPLRWYAPESVNRWHFSSASDVWSFGVTMHEIFSYGAQPYGELTWEQVFDLIDEGQRLAKPIGCPDAIYQIMTSCWEYQPADRPSFSELNALFMSNEFLSAFAIPPKTITDPLSPTGRSNPGSPSKKVTINLSNVNSDESNKSAQIRGSSSLAQSSSNESNRSGNQQVFNCDYTTGSSSGYGSFVKYVETSAVNLVEAEVYDTETNVPIENLNIDECSESSNSDSKMCNATAVIKPPDKVVNKDSLAKIKRPSKFI